MLNSSERLTFAELRRELGKRRQGRPLNPATFHRWIHHGLRGVRLRVTCEGGIYITTRAWLKEFFDAVTARRIGEQTSAAPTPRTPGQRRRQSELAGKELDRRLRSRGTRRIQPAAARTKLERQ
jgi:hypothetical protein